MKDMPLYRLEIAPLVILPLERSPFFSYLSHKPVSLGSLVRIPFGKRSIEGVVFDCAPLPGRAPHWIKKIERIVQPEYLTPGQCELAQEVSEEYFTPLGKTLIHFLPAKTRPRKKPKPLNVKPQKFVPKKEEAYLVETIIHNQAAFLDPSSLASSERWLIALAKKTMIEKKQALFLVPEFSLLPKYKKLFLNYFSDAAVAVISSQLAPGQYSDAWERIRTGQAAIVLATRQGLFAPWKHLSLITLLEEQDESYKQWNMSPRYDGRRVADMLARTHRASLLYVSRTPSMSVLERIRTGTVASLHPIPRSEALGKRLTLVNLRLERFKKNYSPLSEALRDAIGATLSHGEQVLLYVHRRGMDAFSVCDGCKNVLRCPESGHPLSGNRDGSFRCLGCSYRTRTFPSCPKCGHLEFRNFGFGTEKVEREIEKCFPRARTFRMDGNALTNQKKADQYFEKARSGQIDILIGTQMALKEPSLPNLSLIAMIDADSLLAFPDYQGDERLFHILSRASKQIPRHGSIFVQTFHPESTFFQRVSELDEQAFSQKILEEREDLFYPPFSRLIALTVSGSTEAAAHQASEALRKKIDATKKKASTYRTSPSHISKHSPRTIQSTFLIKTAADQPLDERLRSLLKSAARTTLIDVDPLSY